MLSVLAPRRPGRHSAAYLDDQADPVPVPVAIPVAPWTKPRPTPTPEHVRGLFTPLRGEEVPLIRPYCRMDDTWELHVVCERRRAEVGYVERMSGPGVVLYGCPNHASGHEQGT
ncbi:hypothetical protein AQF52_2395 [Streptomyces venezuelae]|uniref:hypothetical protein n=1 Tax=Streptomyces gardneri TaxID=66892 RepID=UPI0006BD12BE|nr:hypothetical protein [Streptomyces gardneri]ALO07990.1 hypothetical protein AQF52_2395 [Streptomyces venezuelae]QPK50982.1 hypothetical protein H4W23_11915 [Streptomyces gardneri]WRK42271.1 hypothetical protein U0M97_11970 [Streptomyces venezuelae]CUM41668.1 hypothetical protein BN2537_12301 [Streptomyces venezuelae]